MNLFLTLFSILLVASPIRSLAHPCNSIFNFQKKREQIEISRNQGVAANHWITRKVAHEISQKGGTSLDMAVASLAVSWVIDPANSSPFGRSQAIISDPESSWSLNASTRIDPTVEVPFPGNLSAIYYLKNQGHLKLGLQELLRPAIDLAEKGFTPSDGLKYLLFRAREDLSRDLKKIYFDPVSGAVRGQVFNPDLATLLKTIGDCSSEPEFWKKLAEKQPIPWRKNLSSNVAISRHLIRSHFTDAEGNEYEIMSTASQESWGPWTILGIETLNQLIQKKRITPSQPEKSVEAYLIAIALVLNRIPFQLGNLKPKDRDLEIFTDLEAEALKLVQLTEKLLDTPSEDFSQLILEMELLGEQTITDDRNTAHFSYAKNNQAVSWTTSIGPWFGIKKSLFGAALPYSYAMKSGIFFNGQTRDVTEQSPMMIRKNGQLWVVTGAAGSERILGALTFIHFLKFGLQKEASFDQLVFSPRVFPKNSKIRIHTDFDPSVQSYLVSRGWQLDPVDYNLKAHLGLVNLVTIDQQSRKNEGVTYRSSMDPSYSAVP